MTQRSIDAYDLPERVARYDADMALMHPNRTKMVDIALEVLPFEPEARLKALDLGAGTGYFSARFLDAYPQSEVHGLDGAPAMIELAGARLRGREENVSLHLGDFREVSRIFAGHSFDVVFTSYALHHLTFEEKVSVVRDAAALLRPGGWLLNADIIVAETPELEQRAQDIRVEGIVKRAQGRDPRFVDRQTTRRYLDEMEAEEGDQPLTLAQDLRALRDAGLRDVSVFWLEYREAATGGRK